ncbi:RNA polymerase I enhancer binding protein [Pleurotus ostreatus]|uniref:RNA polymerase I enhancer binding protein n=2 Tax=Pleurotus ostreatus TaxID=5322 RepID=A0A8H6ZTW9_PLEOS|nr:RNA polymerase I enhancer binding protein [Pleurotus ostreatus]KAF7430794.1 RNA polymerase I enhancer binding protein [Pleurotus ostreatus]KAJ8695150.1 RNA polymerase I enhancer binding protein [Pleurotus ostreatus]
MSTIAPQALTSDIQLALEQAIDQANSAFNQTTGELNPKKKNKKKRIRESDAGLADGAEGSQPQEKKKKKKHGGGHAQVEGTDSGSSGSQHQSHPRSPVEPDAVHDDVQASTAAFISAIVAAASTSSSDTQSPSDMATSFMEPTSFLPFPHDAQQSQPQFGFLPGMAPPPMGVPFADLSLATNDDVLRAIQALDVSKIADVLKTLNEAAATANIPLNIPVNALETPLPATPLPKPLPGADTRRPPQRNMKNPKHIKALAARSAEQQIPSDHAQLLATKWMSTTKLAELVQTEGLVYKKGKFSAIEEQQLRDAIDKYREEKQVTEEDLLDIIFGKKSKESTFWSDITSAIPQRPLIAVYHHVRRHFHPMAQQGKWTAEEDALLKQAVADLGQQWEKVSPRVGRMSADCRDRYRNHIVNRDIRLTGGWSRDEEERLTQIVTEMTVQQGKNIDNDIFWGKVSERMGGTRGRQQCRIKWTDTLSKTVKNDGQRPRWSPLDAFILVHKVDSMNVMDDTEIDWKTLLDPDWNLWSAHSLQRRWLTMKRSIKGYENMSHLDIMEILRTKKAQVPDPLGTGRKRKDRKVMSSEAIEEDPGVDDDHIDDS